MTDSTIKTIRQGGDTLYEYNCLVDRPCDSKLEAHYKILNTQLSEKFTILKLESLDSIPWPENFCPDKQFSIMVFKNININQLEYLQPIPCLAIKQLDTIQINTLALNEKTAFTFFSKTYLKELSGLKRISTQNEAKEALDAIKNNNFDAGRISYSAQELSKACIEKGYNPMGAGIYIDSLLKSL